MDARNWELVETLVDALGSETLIESILKALSSDTANEILESIATDWDII